MNVSTLYLKNHLDLGEVTPEQIAEKLTFAGAEVEAIRAEARGSHLVIGEILPAPRIPTATTSASCRWTKGRATASTKSSAGPRTPARD